MVSLSRSRLKGAKDGGAVSWGVDAAAVGSLEGAKDGGAVSWGGDAAAVGSPHAGVGSSNFTFLMKSSIDRF